MPGRHSLIQRYVQQHMSLYLFVSILFVMGVIFGAFLVNALSYEQQQSMAQYLDSFFQTVLQGLEDEAPQTFAYIFGSHIKWVLFILLFGLSMIGLPLILIVDFLKGMLIGFSIGYLVGQFSWKGLFFALISVAPQNLIIIPVILISSVTAISFSMYLIRGLILRKKQVHIKPLKSYLVTHVALFLLVVCAAFIQYMFVPAMLDWAIPIMLES